MRFLLEGMHFWKVSSQVIIAFILVNHDNHFQQPGWCENVHAMKFAIYVFFMLTLQRILKGLCLKNEGLSILDIKMP